MTAYRNMHRAWPINTQPAPFDPRDASERDTEIVLYTDDALMHVDDPLIRADVIAERTDHAPLADFSGPRPCIARRAFDLLAPDVDDEAPMSAERRAAMHNDRETIKALLIYTAAVVSVGVLCWSITQIAINLWLLVGVAGALS